MSTMWRLMLTWGIILELLNNQSQTSHRRIHYAWNSWAVSCEHLDQFQCWYWLYLTTVPTWRMILGRSVSQSWSSWPVSMTSRLTTVPTWWMILEQSNSREHLDQGRCGKWKQVAALFGVKDVTVLGARVPWWSIPDEKSKRSSNWMCRLSRKPQILFRMFP